MEPEVDLLDRFILSLSEKKDPKVCFIGTGSGDSERYRDNFYSAYKKLPCQPTHLSLFKPPTRDFESFIRDQDIVHVGGGNTKNLLCLWKEWGLDKVLLSAYQSGLILTGMSAGMICWFEECVTDSYGDQLKPLDGLGILKGSACPHFDGEADREPTYLKLLNERKIKGGLALDDGAGALYLNENLDGCFSSRKTARALLFSDGSEAKKMLPTKYLG